MPWLPSASWEPIPRWRRPAGCGGGSLADVSTVRTVSMPPPLFRGATSTREPGGSSGAQRTWTRFWNCWSGTGICASNHSRDSEDSEDVATRAPFMLLTLWPWPCSKRRGGILTVLTDLTPQTKPPEVRTVRTVRARFGPKSALTEGTPVRTDNMSQSRYQPTQAATCPRCSSGDFRLSWQLFSNQTSHIRRTCAQCGRHLGFAPQTPGNIEAANTNGNEEPLTRERLLW